MASAVRLRPRFKTHCHPRRSITHAPLHSSPKPEDPRGHCSSVCLRSSSAPRSYVLQYSTKVRSAPPSSDLGEESGSGKISDHEYNVRLGKAMYTLETTLPKFFQIGLVSCVDADTDVSRSEASSERPPPGHAPDSIYAPNIRLSYTPPAALSLPSAFPKTLQVEGLPLYHASAAFIRHTLSAFNTELEVSLCKLTLCSMGPRDRQIVIRTIVTAKSRLSGTQNEWDVQSTYTVSPDTALIEQHVVESIHPAPHVSFYDGLRAALTRLAGNNMDHQPADGMQGCVPDPKLERLAMSTEQRRGGIPVV